MKDFPEIGTRIYGECECHGTSAEAVVTSIGQSYDLFSGRRRRVIYARKIFDGIEQAIACDFDKAKVRRVNGNPA